MVKKRQTLRIDEQSKKSSPKMKPRIDEQSVDSEDDIIFNW